MKKYPSVKAICIALIVIGSIQIISLLVKNITILSMDSTLLSTGNNLVESIMIKNTRESFTKKRELENIKQEIEIASLQASSPVIVYNGMTMDELAAKLELSLNSNLKGYSMSFAKYSIEYGVDPYLALAISLHETGCTWNCSSLVRKCNNVGGMKGSGCGSYASFASLDEGIEAMIRNLANNYIKKGLTTPESIGKKLLPWTPKGMSTPSMSHMVGKMSMMLTKSLPSIPR